MDPEVRSFRFGVFEADTVAGELRKNGRRIRLQELPWRVLIHLLERAGEVVSREELRHALWPEGTFVEFDQGLNTAVRKLREALNDSPGNPRFIETIPRKGYRFIAPVSVIRFHAELAEPKRGPPPVSGNRLLIAAIVFFMLWAGTVLLWQPAPVPALLWPRMLTSFPGTEMEPAFNPEGDSIAFSWKADAASPFHVYVKRLDEDEPVQLTAAPADDISPSWSPDGRLIAFCRYRSGVASQVFVIPASGGVEIPVATIGVVLGSQPRPLLAWTPDSRFLAVSDRHGAGDGTANQPPDVREGHETASLYLVPLDGGARKRLTFPPPGSPGDGAPAFSPDGRLLAFVRSATSGIAVLHVVAVSNEYVPIGEPRPVTSGLDYAASPAWVPGGREVVFATGMNLGAPTSNSSRLWRIAVQGRPQHTVLPIAAGSAMLPAISRRGRLVFTQATLDTNIWRVELTDGHSPLEKSLRCLICSTRVDAAPRISPDGNQIAFISDRSGTQEVWIASADGSNQIQLTSMRAAVTASPCWSPGGGSLVFDSNKGGRFQIYSISVAGGEPRALTSDPWDSAAASYSKDGQWIYFTSNRTGESQIWKMSAGGGTAVQITRNGGRMALESADGKYLYYTAILAHGQQNAVWQVPVGGGEESMVVADVAPFHFAVAGDGIFFSRTSTVQNGSSIGFFSVADRSATMWPPFDRSATQGISVSPDGRWLLYGKVDHAGADLMLVEGFR